MEPTRPNPIKSAAPIPDEGRVRKSTLQTVVSEALEAKPSEASPLKKSRITPDYVYSKVEEFFIGDNKIVPPVSYYGEMKDGLPNGKGSLIDSRGFLQYEGELKAGKVNGSGKFYGADGSGDLSFEGICENGEISRGKSYRDRNQLAYEGEFRNDRPNGSGVIYFRDGRRYEGHVKTIDDSVYPDGYGIMYPRKS
jgi:hypothetical protein